MKKKLCLLIGLCILSIITGCGNINEAEMNNKIVTEAATEEENTVSVRDEILDYFSSDAGRLIDYTIACVVSFNTRLKGASAFTTNTSKPDTNMNGIIFEELSYRELFPDENSDNHCVYFIPAKPVGFEQFQKMKDYLVKKYGECSYITNNSENATSYHWENEKETFSLHAVQNAKLFNGAAVIVQFD